MQDEREDCLEIVIADSKLISNPSSIEWDIRDLSSNDLPAVCRICREAFPLEYSETWFKEVCSGRYISFGLFHFGTLAGLLVAELKLLSCCDIEVSQEFLSMNLVECCRTKALAGIVRMLSSIL